MRYQLNFLSTTADKQRRKRSQHFTALFYIIIWVFSGYVLFQVYTTQLFMANVHQNRVSRIVKKIAAIEPRILFLEKKIAERNRLRNQSSFYVHENNRPSVWMARLVDIARLLPPDLILTKISFKPQDKKNMKKPEIVIDGYAIIEGNEQDIFAVDKLRSELSESLPTRFTYSKLLVENNRIYKEEEKLKLVFSLGYYQ